MIKEYNCKHMLGEVVEIGVGIRARVEEIIWARNMTTPFYLVEWWQDGQLQVRRMHEADCRTSESAP